MNSDVVRWTSNCDKYSIIANKYRQNRISLIKSLTQSCRYSVKQYLMIMTKSSLFIREFYKIISIIFLLIQTNLILSNTFVIFAVITTQSTIVNGHYTPTWAVHIPNGDNGVADRVAAEHGFINLGKIFDDHYHFHHNSVTKRSLNPSQHHHEKLSNDERVLWAKQQRAKSRRKRDFIRMRPSRTSSSQSKMSLVNSVQLSDPKWPEMWYLNRGNGLDMNVIPAWKDGITGKGVVVTILDDGLESDHPDLENNYDPKASYDVNGHDEDPMPHYDMTDSNRHGTRCAGEVAATANNSWCAVGIAYGASVGGVRMLDGDVTDAVEARSLSLNPQHIDIYSASWGPDDDGKTVDGPGELASRAFIEGVTKGRDGKGSIFIWASGNGGRELDNCNCDGYTNSIWTLSISSATEEGHVPWYSEKCSSTLSTTYSSGGQGEKQVVTTDLHHSCTPSHTGTSASAPLAAGIVALVLEANGNLTWRDLQHIVVRTAKPGNLKDPTWSKNGVGRRISHSFGYGLMDASAMVKVARAWKTVPEQQRCEVNAPHVDKIIPARSYITLQLTVKHCMGVNFLEHVQAKITLTSQRRGDIQIYLKSPAGTKVTLLTSRIHDVSRSGFNQWPFMSVHTWGEAPHGNWQLEIHNEGRYMGHALLREWSLIFYGTATPIDKNDPLSVRTTTSPNLNSSLSSASPSSTLVHHQLHSAQYPILSSSSSNTNHYSISILNKQNSKMNTSTNNSSTRKQQQQHHQISPYGVVITSSKKNNKNSKNNSSGSKGSSKNNNGQNKPSTNRPNLQSTQFGGTNVKNNFYRISTSTNKASTNLNGKQSIIQDTTQRPKIIQQSGYVNLNGGTISNNKSGRIHEKIPIKAPKQVKDNNAYSTIISTPSSLIQTHQRYDSYERIATQNPRIPKLFQQYEKIQQIFPEFHPYTGPKDIVTNPDTSSIKSTPNKKQYPFYETPDRNPTRLGNIGDDGGGGGGGRSELGKTKTISVTNPKPSRENSKKMTPDFQNENQRDRIYIPNRKNSKAQITQWSLIFYGTETPAQPDDDVRVDPGGYGTYNGDMEHNLLDFDPETASGQWRNMQQVGESHVDVQRTTNDQTSSACLNYTPDQRCLECIQTTFLYNSRCYTTCPDYTYMIPETAASSVTSRIIDSDLEDLLPQERAIMYPLPQKLCGSCHSSCLKCHGPNSKDCLACAKGYHLRIITSDESYCYQFTDKMAKNNLSRATNDMNDTNFEMQNSLYIFLIIVLPSILLIFVIVVITIIGKKLFWSIKANRNNYTYDRVALNSEEDGGLKTNELYKGKIHNERNFPSTSGIRKSLNVASPSNQRLYENNSDSEND